MAVAAEIWNENPRPVPDQARALLQRLQAETAAPKADRAWQGIPQDVRCLLLALCTEITQARAPWVRWSDLSDVEKVTIGVQARSFVRHLGGCAEFLR